MISTLLGSEPAAFNQAHCSLGLTSRPNYGSRRVLVGQSYCIQVPPTLFIRIAKQVQSKININYSFEHVDVLNKMSLCNLKHAGKGTDTRYSNQGLIQGVIQISGFIQASPSLLEASCMNLCLRGTVGSQEERKLRLGETAS